MEFRHIGTPSAQGSGTDGKMDWPLTCVSVLHTMMRWKGEFVMANEEQILSILSDMRTDIRDLKAGQAKLEAGQARLEADVTGLRAGQAKLEAGQARLETGQVETNQYARAILAEIGRVEFDLVKPLERRMVMHEQLVNFVK